MIWILSNCLIFSNNILIHICVISIRDKQTSNVDLNLSTTWDQNLNQSELQFSHNVRFG